MPYIDYLSEKISWSETDNPEYPYRAVYEGKKMFIRVNEFPAEHLYTLIAGDKEVAEFDDWSPAWNRYGKLNKLLEKFPIIFKRRRKKPFAGGKLTDPNKSKVKRDDSKKPKAY